jgi:2-hydroxychromene-2-carboxylate isomerase
MPPSSPAPHAPDASNPSAVPGPTEARGPSDAPGGTIDFFFDPVCPFAWMTSRWMVQVAGLRGLDVHWRFIALRMVNAAKDYDTDFPEGYRKVHGAGLRMLRVAAAVRGERGNDAVGDLYTALGESIWDQPPSPGSMVRSDVGDADHLRKVLDGMGLPVEWADAADDEAHDELIGAETELALTRAGRDVGTPIITFGAPDGPSFFGPVISRLPSDDDAVRLWDAVETIAGFDSFAELKRSLREMPAVKALEGFRF